MLIELIMIVIEIVLVQLLVLVLEERVQLFALTRQKARHKTLTQSESGHRLGTAMFGHESIKTILKLIVCPRFARRIIDCHGLVRGGKLELAESGLSLIVAVECGRKLWPNRIRLIHLESV